MSRSTRRLYACLLLCLLATTAVAGERGSFGFAPAVTTSGFILNPTVDRIVIAGIVPGSPAARAGLVAGDEVLTIEGTQVAGAKALALRSLAQRDVGQTLHATLRHHGGAVYSVSMVAVPRPKQVAPVR
jgi:predicted metalloprotease with PDZ domain